MYESLKAPHSKFVYCRNGPSCSIPEPPDLWAFFECHSVPHPFLSRVVPPRSVANSVARSHFVPGAVLAHRSCLSSRSRGGPRSPGPQVLKFWSPHSTPPPKILPETIRLTASHCY